MTYPPPYDPQPGSHPTQPVPPPASSPPTTPYPTYLGPHTAPPRPPRSNGPILAVVIALAVLLIGGTVTAGVLLVNSGDDPGKVTTGPTTDPRTPRPDPTEAEPEPTSDDYASSGSGTGEKVVYEVTGDGPVSIVFLKEDGVTPERASDTDLPWRTELTLSEEAALVTVTAIRSGRDQGKIECRITVDGKEVAKKSANGTFATATCTKLLF